MCHTGFRKPAMPRWLLVLAASAGMSGCSYHYEDAWSRHWPARAPAGGTVTFEGRPVEGATVVFVTQSDGRFYHAVGTTESVGRFRLQTFRPQDGAVPGSHAVMIEKITYTDKPGGGPAPARMPAAIKDEKSHLPARYRSPKTSGLTADVTAKGPNEFTFVLE